MMPAGKEGIQRLGLPGKREDEEVKEPKSLSGFAGEAGDVGRPGSDSRKVPGLEETLGRAEGRKESGGSRRIRIAPAGREVGGRGGSQ